MATRGAVEKPPETQPGAFMAVPCTRASRPLLSHNLGPMGMAEHHVWGGGRTPRGAGLHPAPWAMVAGLTGNGGAVGAVSRPAERKTEFTQRPQQALGKLSWGFRDRKRHQPETDPWGWPQTNSNQQGTGAGRGCGTSGPGCWVGQCPAWSGHARGLGQSPLSVLAGPGKSGPRAVLAWGQPWEPGTLLSGPACWWGSIRTSHGSGVVGGAERPSVGPAGPDHRQAPSMWLLPLGGPPRPQLHVAAGVLDICSQSPLPLMSRLPLWHRDQSQALPSATVPLLLGEHGFNPATAMCGVQQKGEFLYNAGRDWNPRAVAT